MNQLKSAVIVQNEHGYIASLRYSDRFSDVDLSSSSKYMIYVLIENHVEATLGKQ
jgi:hypothetical protein